jgi:hypothetical protein
MTDPTTPPAVLVVANSTASTPALLGEVQLRAKTGARFLLLIPPVSEKESDWTAEDAQRLLGRACGAGVECIDAGPNPADTIHRAVADGACGEVIVSTRPEHHVLWFHHDLPARLQDLSVPVTVIPPEPDSWGPIEGFPPDWVPHAASPSGIAGLGNY